MEDFLFGIGNALSGATRSMNESMSDYLNGSLQSTETLALAGAINPNPQSSIDAAQRAVEILGGI